MIVTKILSTDKSNIVKLTKSTRLGVQITNHRYRTQNKGQRLNLILPRRTTRSYNKPRPTTQYTIDPIKEKQTTRNFLASNPIKQQSKAHITNIIIRPYASRRNTRSIADSPLYIPRHAPKKTRRHATQNTRFAKEMLLDSPRPSNCIHT